MNMKAQLSLEGKIRQLLYGIDRTETDVEEGWWETTSGAEFGKQKLEALIALIQADSRSEEERRDASVAARIKLCNTPELKVAWLNHARAIISKRVQGKVYDFDLAAILPTEDCEAVLRATGKLKD